MWYVREGGRWTRDSVYSAGRIGVERRSTRSALVYAMLGSVSLTSHFDVTMKKLVWIVLNSIIHHSHADTDTAHRASSSSQRPASEQPEPPSAHPRTPPAAIHPPSAQRPASERASAPGQPVQTPAPAPGQAVGTRHPVPAGPSGINSSAISHHRQPPLPACGGLSANADRLNTDAFVCLLLFIYHHEVTRPMLMHTKSNCHHTIMHTTAHLPLTSSSALKHILTYATCTGPSTSASPFPIPNRVRARQVSL